MEKDSKEKKTGWLEFFLIFVVGTLFSRYILDLVSWEINVLVGFGTAIVFFLLIKFKIIKIEKKKPKEDKNEFIEMKTDKLEKLIKEEKEFIEKAEKEYDKRKDKSLRYKMGEEFKTLIWSGGIIIILGILYLGALPGFFGVNDELSNPTNFSNLNSTYFENVTNAYEIVGESCKIPFKVLAKQGAENPKVFFWLWWLFVLLFMVIPIIKIIYYSSKTLKGGKSKWGLKKH